MTTDPATVRVSDPVFAARQLFVSSDFHHLPVVEDGLLVGIISSSGLLKFHVPDGDAATTLSNGGYHSLPVVEDNGEHEHSVLVKRLAELQRQ